MVFRVNGAVVRTSALAVVYPLFVEATLGDEGATVVGAELDGSLGQAVTWAGNTYANAIPGALSKSRATRAWDAGAFSTMALEGVADGYVEVNASVSPTLAMVGLANGNTNSGHPDIDYALYMSSGTLHIFEGGVNRGSFGSLSAADKLRVSVEGGVVVYRKNGTLLYTSTLAPTFPLLVDTSLHSDAARISGVVLSGSLVQVAAAKPTLSTGSGLYSTAQTVFVHGEAGATLRYTTTGVEPTESDAVIASGSSLLIEAGITLKVKAWRVGLYPSSTAEAWYVFAPAASENVEWTAQVNATAQGSTLSKATAVVAWDAGAISTRGLAAPDGYLEVSASVGTKVAMVGLSNGNTNAGHPDIDHALYFASGTLYVYERGINRGSFGPLLATDKLRVSVEAGLVRYRKNGALLYTSTHAPAYPLLVDSSLYSSGASIEGAILSGVLVDNAVPNPAFSFPSGIYETAIDVVVTGAPGSTIHYTTNGVDPTAADPMIASGAVLSLGVSTQLKARAFAPGLIPSGTTAAIYQFGTTTTEDVVWSGHVNSASNGATISKTTGAVAWDAGAISTRGIISPGGYLEVSGSSSPNTAMVGLSNGSATSGYTEIDFALYLASNTLYIYESGVNRGSFGAINNADKLRVSVENGVVKYRRNGVLLYTSAIAPSYPLLADVSLHSSAAHVKDAVISGNLVNVAAAPPVFSVGSGLYQTAQEVVITADAGLTIHYTTNGAEPTQADATIASGASLLIESDTTLKAKAWASGLYPSSATTAIYKFGIATTENVAWTAHVNSSSVDNNLSKSISTTAWDASAVSSAAIDSPDGYVEVNASLSPKLAMVGLAHGNTNSAYADIDYAVYMSAGTLYVYEGGLSRGSFGSLVASDKLRVSVEGGVIRYRKNGTLFYTSAIAPKYPLLVDSSLHSTTASIQNAVISGLLISSRTSAPTASPEAGGHALPIEVALSADSGATIRYTTNGSDPTASSTLYSAPISVAAATTIKARAFKTGYLESAVSTHAYFLNLPGAAPTLSPGPGAHVGPLVVTTITSTPGGLIHYTVNGGDPTESDPSVPSGGGILIPTTSVLRATTFAPGYSASAVVTAPYEVVTPAPATTPAPGAYLSSVSVSISAMPGAAIYYTTDGDTPTPASTLYSAPFALTATGTVRAIAWVSGWSPSAISEATFTVTQAQVEPQALLYWSTALVLKPDGTVWGWGHNFQGLLPGIPADTEALLPIQLPITGVKRLALGGGGFMLALKSDGTVWGWGTNNYGQLGGSDPLVSTPRQIDGLSGVTSVAAGSWNSLVLKSDGTVWSWGMEASGPTPTPAQVLGLPTVTAIAASDRQFLALTSAGTVWSWGDARNAGRGEYPWGEDIAPGVIPTLSDIASISSIYSVGYAVTSTGVAYMFGNSDFDDLFVPRTVPEVVLFTDDGYTTTGALTDVKELSYGLVIHTDGRVRELKWDVTEAGNDRLTAGLVMPAGSATTGAGNDNLVVLSADGKVFSWGPYHDQWWAPTGEGAHIARPDPVDIALPGFNWRAGTPLIAVTDVGGTPTVTLSTASPDGVLYYTTDGSDPNASSNEYSAAFPQPAGTALRVVAIAPDRAPSHFSEIELLLGSLPAPEFSPDGGTFPGVAAVTVTHPTAGATLRYRTDGAEPTLADLEVVSGQTLMLDSSAVLRVKATKPHYQSNEKSATFLIEAAITAPVVFPPSGPVVGTLVMTALTQQGVSARYEFGDLGVDPVSDSQQLPYTTKFPPRFEYTASELFTVVVRAFNDVAAQPPSLVQSYTYTLHSARPTVSAPFDTPQGPMITITPDVPEDGIVYLVNGAGQAMLDPQSSTLPAAGLITLRATRGGGVGLSPWVTLDFRDPDGDGLTDSEEAVFGTNPHDADTNDDGVTDGNAIAAGISATSVDVDGDGVANALELSRGTSPFDADTDNDGFSDAVDAFPLDPTRNAAGSPSGPDATPPIITLLRPVNAVKVGS